MATNDTPSDSEKRAVKALTDVVAVEQYAPGMVRVVTWSDSYIVDARGGGCNCPDKEYNIHESDASRCKHEQAAMLYDSDMVQSLTVDDDLSTPTVDSSADKQVATDGGNERPADCDCLDSHKLDDPLPCFPCVRDGFDTPNPNPNPSEDMAADTDADADPVAVADGGEVDECKYPSCSRAVGQQDRDDYRSRSFCSVQCETKYDHIKADAQAAERQEPTRHEPADMGGGETTGVQDL